MGSDDDDDDDVSCEAIFTFNKMQNKTVNKWTVR